VINLKYFCGLFLGLLMFSNVMSRAANVNLNTLFYLSFVLIFILSLRNFFHKKMGIWKIIYIWVVVWVFLYVFDFRYSFSANLLSIKDFIIPILTLIIGYYFAFNRVYVINTLNYIYLPFISYGIIQELLFYRNGLEEIIRVLPWEGPFIKSILLQGGLNYFQGSLLRFFGTMNAFVEYQIFVVGALFFIWVNFDFVKRQNLFKLNLILMALFLALCLERTPVAMAIIIIFIWKFKYLLSKPRRLFFWGAIVILAAGIFLYFGQEKLKNNPLVAKAYIRLNNVLTLNLGDDAAIRDRSSDLWIKGLEAAKGNYFGIGLETVTPSASQYPGYIGPHNNFVAYYMGYGIIGLGLILALFILVAAKISTLNSNYRYFGYGFMLSYAGMAMFNLPFSGKQGILFFLIMGFLLSMRKINHTAIKNKNLAVGYN
jgi:hypothetical protein